MYYNATLSKNTSLFKLRKPDIYEPNTLRMIFTKLVRYECNYTTNAKFVFNANSIAKLIAQLGDNLIIKTIDTLKLLYCFNTQANEGALSVFCNNI